MSITNATTPNFPHPQGYHPFEESLAALEKDYRGWETLQRMGAEFANKTDPRQLSSGELTKLARGRSIKVIDDLVTGTSVHVGALAQSILDAQELGINLGDRLDAAKTMLETIPVVIRAGTEGLAAIQTTYREGKLYDEAHSIGTQVNFINQQNYAAAVEAQFFSLKRELAADEPEMLTTAPEAARFGYFQRLHHSLTSLPSLMAGTLGALRTRWGGLSQSSIRELEEEISEEISEIFLSHEEKFLMEVGRVIKEGQQNKVLEMERMVLQGTINDDMESTPSQVHGQEVIKQFLVDIFRGMKFRVGNEGTKETLFVPNYSKMTALDRQHYTEEMHLRRSLSAISLVVGTTEDPIRDSKWKHVVQAVCTQSPKNTGLMHLKGTVLAAAADLARNLAEEDSDKGYHFEVTESTFPITVRVKKEENNRIAALFVTCSIPLTFLKIKDTDRDVAVPIESNVDLTVKLSFVVKLDEEGKAVISDYSKEFEGEGSLTARL